MEAVSAVCERLPAYRCRRELVTSLTQIMVRQGCGDQARERLKSIVLRFTEGFKTKDLIEARFMRTGLLMKPAEY